MQLSILLLSLVACKTPVEAPADLGADTLFLFQHFDDDPEHLVAGTPVLEEWIMGLDPTASTIDRSVEPPILTEEHWGGVTGPAGQDAADQLPVAVAGFSRHPLDTHMAVVSETNHVCLESNTTVYYRRTFLEGDDCFPAEDCDTVRTVNEVYKDSVLAKVWYDIYKDYRLVTLDDGRDVLYARGWIEEQFMGDGGDTSWDQMYLLEAWIPNPDDDSQSLRFYALWSGVTLGLPDDMYVSTAMNGMDEGFENGDDFFDGTLCDNDRDAEYERP